MTIGANEKMLMVMTLEDIKKEYEQCPLLKHLDVNIITFKEDNVKIKITVQPYMLNTNGSLHGGVYASLLDTILSMHLRSVTLKRCVTANLTINYTAPIKEGAVYAEASIISRGYRTAFVEGILRDETNKILSKGTGVFKIIN